MPSDSDKDDCPDPRLWYADADGDTYGYEATSVVSCDRPVGYVADRTDCNDNSGDAFPGHVEVCDDGLDNNCDGILESCEIDLSEADAQYTGENSGDYAGFSVAGAGDVNADGYADLLVGADYSGYTAGAAYLVLGSATPDSLNLSIADAQYIGENTGNYAGVSVSGAGDVNADGYADMLVGAYYNSDGGFAAGAAYLLLGSVTPSSLNLSNADAQYTGDNSNDRAGFSVSGAGDVNADGYADVLVGACGDPNTSTGVAYLVLGDLTPGSLDLSAADALYTGERAGDCAGISVSGAGDVNADGYADLMVGACFNDDGGTFAGAAYLVLGGGAPSSLNLSAADALYIGENASDLAGASVSDAGDVNADGYADLLIGAYVNDDGGIDAGAAYLLLGNVTPISVELSAADAQYTGVSANDWTGGSVSGAGDVNADGYADVLVGAPHNDDGGSDAGVAYLVLGSANPSSLYLSDADELYAGANADDYVGWSVSGVGDVNADNYTDLLVGAYGNDSSGSAAGAAYLVLGTP